MRYGVGFEIQLALKLLDDDIRKGLAISAVLGWTKLTPS